MLSPSLDPLRAYPQWVAWQIEMRPGADGVLKPSKVPYSPVHGYPASTRKPQGWSSYERAREFAATRGMPGVGFVFTEQDPFFFLDMDKALVAGQWSQLSQQLCARVHGAAVEVSQSGTGLHAIGMTLGAPEHRNKNVGLNIELYTKWRFVALTDSQTVGNVLHDHTAALASIIAEYFAPEISDGILLDWTDEPVAEWSGPESDDELILKALRSEGGGAQGAFGTRAKFRDLFDGNADVLGKCYPPQTPGQAYDGSGADLALANLLSFWTGRNCERIERIMQRSALKRDKWEERPDWLEETILKAVRKVQGVYRADYKPGQTAQPPASPPPAAPPPEAPPAPDASQPPLTGQDAMEAVLAKEASHSSEDFQFRMGSAMVPFHAHADHFAGCVYINSLNRIWTPRGRILGQPQFDTEYGGHTFVLDSEGKKTITSAWTCFRENQSFRPHIVDDTCFRPEHGSGAIVNENGFKLLNTFVAPEVRRIKGDVSKYLDLLERQLPDERDREILLTYMASVVQNPGRKAQWWPVIQGGQGNGKTVHINVMRFAVGARYSHLVNTDKLTRGQAAFNGWVDRRLFVGLEEIRGTDRRNFFESFKTMVTNDSIPVEKKGVDEATLDNRCNGMITTNHKDGVPIGDGDRRYCIFFTAQQSLEDLEHSGMTAEFWEDFMNWLKGFGPYADHGNGYGLAVIAEYLSTRHVTREYDPYGLANVAPTTSAKAEAVEVSRGRIEQEIQEAIHEGEQGFCGDWISSAMFRRFLENRRLGGSIGPHRRREIIENLGYGVHPKMEGSGGRTSTPVMPDNCKTTLYCKRGSISWGNLSDHDACKRAYTKAQQGGTVSGAGAPEFAQS